MRTARPGPGEREVRERVLELRPPRFQPPASLAGTLRLSPSRSLRRSCDSPSPVSLVSRSTGPREKVKGEGLRSAAQRTGRGRGHAGLPQAR